MKERKTDVQRTSGRRKFRVGRKDTQKRKGKVEEDLHALTIGRSRKRSVLGHRGTKI